jgi:hypothetical protein
MQHVLLSGRLLTLPTTGIAGAECERAFKLFERREVLPRNWHGVKMSDSLIVSELVADLQRRIQLERDFRSGGIRLTRRRAGGRVWALAVGAADLETWREIEHKRTSDLLPSAARSSSKPPDRRQGKRRKFFDCRDAACTARSIRCFGPIPRFASSARMPGW